MSASLLFLSSPLSSSAVRCRGATHHHRPRAGGQRIIIALMSPGMGSTSQMYAASPTAPQPQTEGHLLEHSLLRGQRVGHGGQFSCNHVELLIRARLYDAQTFTLLTDPQSIMAISLRFMTSKVMERVPVLDWKTGWEVSTGAISSCLSRRH